MRRAVGGLLQLGDEGGDTRCENDQVTGVCCRVGVGYACGHKHGAARSDIDLSGGESKAKVAFQHIDERIGMSIDPSSNFARAG